MKKAERAKRRRMRELERRLELVVLVEVILVMILLAAVIITGLRRTSSVTSSNGQSRRVLSAPDTASVPNASGSEAESDTDSGDAGFPDSVAEAAADVTKVQYPEEKVEKIPFTPHATEETEPSVMLSYSEIRYDGTVLEDKTYYTPWYHMDFGVPGDYTDVDGIVTFRGNPFRDTAAVGCADMKENTISRIWTKSTGSLQSGEHTWSGNGWTGQPLMARWSPDVRRTMNLYDSAKAKEDLVEVIYASMDGYVYFLDLETGEPTRDALYLGFTFKGAGSLDPRGYPILYVGAGYNSEEKGTARIFIINLLDTSVMYTFGDNDSFSLRGSLSYFDSSPLVDAESDTLIYPGENGVLYLVQLNTQYDAEGGTISIDPGHFAKWRYMGKRSGNDRYWLGMEDSAAIYGGYMFIADNGGHLMCVDLNTLFPVWVQDILDDSNSTPVLCIEDGHLYLYVSTSFHLGWRSDTTAPVPIWKIDAENGTVVWKTEYECYSESGVSGGVQSTVACGKRELADYIYVTVSRTGDDYSGVLACLNKKDGKIEWEHKAVYAWSSPVCIYRPDGTGNVLYGDAAGRMYLLNGKTGEVYDTLDDRSQTIEASPAVYENHVVVGTRDCEIWGLELG